MNEKYKCFSETELQVILDEIVEEKNDALNRGDQEHLDILTDRYTEILNALIEKRVSKRGG